MKGILGYLLNKKRMIEGIKRFTYVKHAEKRAFGKLGLIEGNPDLGHDWQESSCAGVVRCKPVLAWVLRESRCDIRE
jgi:hypothetical protein